MKIRWIQNHVKDSNDVGTERSKPGFIPKVAQSPEKMQHSSLYLHGGQGQTSS